MKVRFISDGRYIGIKRGREYWYVGYGTDISWVAVGEFLKAKGCNTYLGESFPCPPPIPSLRAVLLFGEKAAKVLEGNADEEW